VKPITKSPPLWLRLTPEEVEALVLKLAREGNSPSKIGTILRDQYSVPLVSAVTNKKVVGLLKENNLAPPVPEDLANLVARARRMSVHLKRFKSDGSNIHRLQLVEAKIKRLERYYKRNGVLPANWEPEIA